MSLYVGHLSPRVRLEDLDRAFQRFGQCNIKLKDGYGFVVYDVPGNAERALRTLRGKIICGEQISLSWSNKQPRAFQRTFRNTRVYEPPLKRFKEDYDGGEIRDSREQRNFQIGTSNIGSPNHKRNHSEGNLFQREAGNSGDYIHDPGEGKGTSLKMVMNEGVSTECDPLENGRWGEPAGETLTGHDMGNNIDFDRYEPYSGLDRSKEDEKKFDCSFGSPDHGSPQKKWQREKFVDSHLAKPKSQLACYHCGLVGHMARNCPQGDPKREKLRKFSHMRVEINSWDRGVRRVKRFRSNSWGRSDEDKNLSIPRRHSRDREDSHSIKVRQTSRNESPLESKEMLKHKHRAESQIPKETKRKHCTSRKRQKKRKIRRSKSLSSSSDSSTASSRSYSQSVRSVSDVSRSLRSRSKSYGSDSENSCSKSASKSSQTRSVSSNSKSKSSFHSSRLLSVPLDQMSPFAGKGEPVDVSGSAFPKNKSENILNPDNMHPCHSNLGKPDPKGTILISKDENASDLVKLDGNSGGIAVGNNGCATQYSSSSFEQKELRSSTEPHKDGADSSIKFSENAIQMNTVLGSSSWKLNGALAINSSRVTSQDLIMALRQYGLVAPDESEMSMSIDRYFGAARLWPWDMIYFRRMKKGPISTENYARRLQQNQEFGIVDRYIRSSSGWGE